MSDHDYAMDEANRIANLTDKTERRKALAGIPDKDRFMVRGYYDMIIKRRMQAARREGRAWRKPR